MAMTITVENVRSFHGRHSVPLRDFTVLVGENSTGKTTFLTVLAALGFGDRFPDRPAFNEPPFSLGNYETIASRKRDSRRNEPSFSIGFVREFPAGSVETLATYSDRSGQVHLSRFSTTSAMGNIEFTLDGDVMEGETRLKLKSGHVETLAFKGVVPREQIELGIPMSYLLLTMLQGRDNERIKEAGQHLPALLDLWRAGTNAISGVVPLAPIRSKPQRTYEQLDSPFKPEGDHIPLRLARILRGSEPHVQRTALKTALERFGKESSLFSAVKIHKLGGSASAPFEILVEVGGQRINIADVGYGVSQVLPVVAESVLAGHNLLLLQQPEVHLHPRAQAALGSFLVRVAKETHLVVETHSDYLIDRIRHEVAAGLIQCDKVLILYFERSNGNTRIHPIDVDPVGNLLNAPPSYRDFFAEEELRVLTRGAI